MVAEAELEIRTTRDVTIPIRLGELEQHVLHVRYRVRGTKRWTRFVLLPNEGEDWPELEGYAALTVNLHRRRAADGSD